MSTLKITRHDRIFEVIIDRPKANAIDAATSREMGVAFAEFRDDEQSIVAIISGAGEKIFSAGWDLKAAASGENEFMDYGVGGFAGLTELFNLNKPVIAAVNGLAIGGGFEIALACDIIFAAEHAEFALPETSIGVMADAGGVQRLPSKVPQNVAMDLLLSGRRMKAYEAAKWGLVNRIVPTEDLLPAAREYAKHLANCAPLSIQAIKQVVRGSENRSVEETFQALRAGEFPLYNKMLHSEDHKEGPRAFSEKRPPVWKGR